jgi:hypothetical protein
MQRFKVESILFETIPVRHSMGPPVWQAVRLATPVLNCKIQSEHEVVNPEAKNVSGSTSPDETVQPEQFIKSATREYNFVRHPPMQSGSLLN